MTSIRTQLTVSYSTNSTLTRLTVHYFPNLSAVQLSVSRRVSLPTGVSEISSVSLFIAYSTLGQSSHLSPLTFIELFLSWRPMLVASYPSPLLDITSWWFILIASYSVILSNLHLAYVLRPPPYHHFSIPPRARQSVYTSLCILFVPRSDTLRYLAI